MLSELGFDPESAAKGQAVMGQAANGINLPIEPAIHADCVGGEQVLRCPDTLLDGAVIDQFRRKKLAGSGDQATAAAAAKTPKTRLFLRYNPTAFLVIR